MSVKNSLELTMTGWAYGGEALGRADDGRVVFVAFALPGERVRVALTEQHSRWARARLLDVIEPSPDRIEARCQHFGQCGGCHYQHMPYPLQLEAKAAVLAEQLDRIGGFSSAPVADTIGSPEPWNYRNRLRFHLTESGRLGFFEWGRHQVFPLQVCHLPLPAIDQLWPQLELEALGGLQEVELRSDGQGEPTLILHGRGQPELTLNLDLPASVIWLSEEGVTVLAGDPYGWMEVRGETFRLSPGAFFQTNSSILDRLVEEVLQAADPQPDMSILELYAGVGMFSRFFAAAGARVTAVEQGPLACADFEVNLASFEGVELYEASVEEALPAISGDQDIIFVDPPRGGLGAGVVDEIIRREPRRLVYLSCDPATMARDGKRLAADGFQLAAAIPLDLFPQTYHIESLTTWIRTTDGLA